MQNTIVKRTKSTHYSLIDNALWTDMRLSGDALRVLGYLLSKPDGWQIREMDIRRRFAKIGQELASNHFYRKVVKHLQEAGYMRKSSRRNEVGQIVEWVTEISDKPVFLEGFEPDVEKPDVEKPDVEFTTCGEFDPLSNTDTSLAITEPSITEGRSAPPVPADLEDLFVPDRPMRKRGQRVNHLLYRAADGYQGLFDSLLGIFPATNNFTEQFERLIEVAPDVTFRQVEGWLEDVKLQKAWDTHYLGSAVNFFAQNQDAYRVAANLDAELSKKIEAMYGVGAF